MSEAQDVLVETKVDAPESVEDVTVETIQDNEPETKEQDQVDDNDSQDQVEVEEKPKTVEERLADFEAKYEEKTRAVEAMQKKIDRQTAAYNAAQRAIQERDARLQELAQGSNQQGEKEPEFDEYESTEQYIEALAGFKANQKIREQEQAHLMERQKQEFERLSKERNDYVSAQEVEYIKQNPRYEASKREFESFVNSAPLPNDVGDAVAEVAFMGNVPEVIDYFGGNNGERLDELEKISKMRPVQAAIEIFKIQQKLASKPAEIKEKPLPKPINTPKGVSGKVKSGKQMSGDELLKWVKS